MVGFSALVYVVDISFMSGRHQGDEADSRPGEKMLRNLSHFPMLFV